MLDSALPEALGIAYKLHPPAARGLAVWGPHGLAPLERAVSQVFSHAPVYLTDAEVDAVCDGLRQNAAKGRYLTGLGLHVNFKPNGRPLVVRSHAENVLAGLKATQTGPVPAQSATPNRAALIQLFNRGAA